MAIIGAKQMGETKGVSEGRMLGAKAMHQGRIKRPLFTIQGIGKHNIYTNVQDERKILLEIVSSIEAKEQVGRQQRKTGATPNGGISLPTRQAMALK